jgi:hypothetical protein
MSAPSAGKGLGPAAKARLLTVLGAGLLLAIFLAVMLEIRAGSELGRARELAAAGDFDSAHRHFFQALNWYAPWGSSQRAADELMALSLEHLKAGRMDAAFQSLLRLRSGLIAARSFYQPRTDLLETATPLIALSLASLKLGQKASREEIKALAAVYQTLYAAAAKRPQRWYMLMVAGFLLWTGSAFRLVLVVFQPSTGNLSPIARLKSLPASSGALFFGYLLWLVSMRMS